jgi:hypothetical protein
MLHHPGFFDFIEIGFFMTVLFVLWCMVDIVGVFIIVSISQ